MTQTSSSRWSRVVLGSLAALLAAGIGLRLKFGAAGGDGDDKAAPAPAASLAQGPDGKPALQLAKGQAEALDLGTAPAQVQRVGDAVALQGVVQDPMPLLDLEARRQATAAALGAAKEAEASARAELARVQALHAADRGASDRALQEARGAAAAASAQRLAAEGEARKAQAAWDQTGLRSTAGLADFSRAVVRLDLPLGQAVPAPLPRFLTGTAPGLPGTLRLAVAGLAPGGSPATGGLALLALTSGRNLRPGLPVEASLPGAVAPRVVVPREALLWSGSKALVFLQAGPGLLEPRTVAVAFPAGGGVALAGGLQGGETLVVRGTLAVQAEYARLAEGASIGAGGV